MNDSVNKENPDADRAPHGFQLYQHRSTGAFVAPDDNTWAAHAHYIKAAEDALSFNTQRYDYFDGIIAEKLGRPALTDPKNADYARFDALRNNIAVLRNFVLVHYEKTGQFDGGARKQRERLESLAEGIGQALANDAWGTRAFTKSTSVDVANIDGVGAMEMYKHLLEIQETPTVRQPLMVSLKNFLALPNRDWGLPPLSESPFSPQALAAPPPDYVSTPLPKADTSSDTNESDAQKRDLENKTQQPETQTTSPQKDEFSESIAISEKAVETVKSLQSIDTLAEIPREESVEEARKILRNLRNMEFTDRNIEEFLDQGTPSTVVAKKQSFARLIDIFAAHLKNAQAANPSIATSNPAVQQARDTANTMALELAEHTRRMLRDEDEREKRLNQLIDSLPHTADLRVSQSVERLLETLELGLEHACGKELANTSLERLCVASERLEQHAILLHQTPPEETPTREESIDLARNLVARMEQLPIGERSLQNFIDTAKPQEHAAFAQAVEEMVSIYHNLKIEAASSNSEIRADAQIKEADETIKGFAHAVKLMAAKEMPNSIASAQQISAAEATPPERWNDLSHHTVNRLIKSAEGGLEKAIGEIAQDSEEQEEDLAQDIIEAALQHTDTAKRKKKRRGGDSKSRSGKGAKKQKKKMLDITADDYSLKQGRFAEESKDMRKEMNTPGNSFNVAQASKSNSKKNDTIAAFDANDRLQGQGRFAELDPVSIGAALRQQQNVSSTRPQTGQQPRSTTRPSGQTAPQGLKEADLAAIAKLGGSLRDIGNQLQGLTVASVSSTDKLAPDNRTQKQQQTDREMNNPRNQGPGKG